MADLVPDLLPDPVPDRPAITSPAGTITYRRLESRIAELAERYQPGQRFAVDQTDPAAVIIAVLAARRAGATAVLVDPAWPAARRAAARTAASAGTSGWRDGLWWIGFTSGSAGTPRPIGRTAASWELSFPLFTELTGIQPGQRVLVGGSMAASLFLFGALHALSAGAHVIAPGRWDPGRLPPAEVAHCVPAMVGDLVAAGPPARLVICAGAALAPAVRRAAVAGGIRVLEYYGATELSFVGWRDDDQPFRPFPGVEVLLRGGELWARSQYLSSGYLAGADTGPLRFDDAGFATVGDLGEVDQTGRITLLGRGDGMILTGGVSVLPHDVEAVLMDLPGVREAVVVGTPHPRLGQVVTAVIEPHPAGPPSLRQLRDGVRGRLGQPQRPRRWYLAATIPRTGSGKAARRQIEQGLHDGSLAARRAW